MWVVMLLIKVIVAAMNHDNNKQFDLRPLLQRTTKIETDIMKLVDESFSLYKIVLLQKQGVDINARDTFGCTALMRAAARDTSSFDSSMTCILLQMGANPCLKDNSGRDAWWYANANPFAQAPRQHKTSSVAEKLLELCN